MRSPHPVARPGTPWQAFAGSLTAHAAVLAAAAWLAGSWGGAGGDGMREVAIGVSPPLLQAPPVEREALPDIICGGDDPQPAAAAEEFPESFHEAVVPAEGAPVWLDHARPSPERRAARLAAATAEAASISSDPAPPALEAAAIQPPRPPAAAPAPNLPPAIAPDSCLPPAYPRGALRRCEEGTVWLRLEVDAAGRPTTVILEISSGHAALDEAALQAARAWRLLPARAGERSVAGVLRVPVRFRLTDAE